MMRALLSAARAALDVLVIVAVGCLTLMALFLALAAVTAGARLLLE